MNGRIIILAGGNGKRMGQDIPKVLTPVLGKPMIGHVLDSVEKVGFFQKPVVVVGFKKEDVEKHVGDRAEFAWQEEQLGTGHAVNCAKEKLRDFHGPVLILYGDHPLIASNTIELLFKKYFEQKATVTIMTTEVEDFESWRSDFMAFGRILRNGSGNVQAIREFRDCDFDQRAIKEVNPGYYCFDSQWLWKNIDQLKNENQQREYYLTDLIELAVQQGELINSMKIDSMECLGVNTKEQLDLVAKFLDKTVDAPVLGVASETLQQQVSNKYDAIIVGAGPAGLFSAYELIKKQPKMKICLIDMGKLIKDRDRSEVMSGIGGAGTFSDGKLHFTPVLSHEKMLHLYSELEYQEYLDRVDRIFTKFGVTADYYPKNLLEALEMADDAKKKSIKLFIRKARHVGSDKLPKVIENFERHLLESGVEIRTETEVMDILTQDNVVQGVKTVSGEEIFADKVILAPGRVKARWLQKLVERYHLGFTYEKVEVGVRVEFAEGILRKHAELMYETIFMMRTPTFDDVVRTFCPCPKGYVAAEKYDDFVCVNGHSNSDHNSNNSNFALVSEVVLTEPVENTIAYAKSIAKLATTIGGGKPILQRVADLDKGRRSTWQRINNSFVKPSLTEVTPGDISMALPYRNMRNILEGLKMLDQVLPGINSGHTLLYAPEIKLRSSKIKTDKNLQTEIRGLYVAGDGAGVAGSITGAAATGLVAAQGILCK